MNISQHMKAIQDISLQATMEEGLQKTFNSIKMQWEALEVILKEYKSDQAKDLFVFVMLDELFEAMDDKLAALNNILGSKFLKLMRSPAEKLQKEIFTCQEMMEDWLACQKSWIYLSFIFSAPDIKKRLPTESNKFDKVNFFFTQVTNYVIF